MGIEYSLVDDISMPSASIFFSWLSSRTAQPNGRRNWGGDSERPLSMLSVQPWPRDEVVSRSDSSELRFPPSCMVPMLLPIVMLPFRTMEQTR